MRAVGLHPDVIVVTSRFWQTTCTLVRSGEEAFCVDSPVLPDELEILPSVADQARFRVVGLLATHADWDHLLGRYAFPDAPLGRRRVDRAAAARRARAERSRRCASSTRRTTSSARGRWPCRTRRRCRCRATARSATQELELHPADGHTADGMAIWIPWAQRARVRRLPLAGRDPDALAGRLARAPTSRRSTGSSRWSRPAAHVVPGHGAPLDAVRAAAILREDRAYLEGCPTRSCRWRGGPARRSGSTRRTSRLWQARRHGAPPARPALHARDRAPEGQGGRGRVEHPRPREGRRRVHAGLASGATATSSSRAARRSSRS